MKMRIWLLTIVAAVLALPSSAQYVRREIQETTWEGSASYEEGQYMDNPCTAVQDLFWVTYSAYADSAQTEAGVNRYLVQEQTTMNGAYATSGVSLSDVGYGAKFSVRKYHKVNTSDNFHVVTVVTVNPVLKTMSLTLETACGNGMPDSQE